MNDNNRPSESAPPPTPRGPVSDPTLQRPDWTTSQRQTAGVMALDKNENTDPEFQRVVAGVVAAVPLTATLEYPECAPYYHLLADHLGLKAENLLFTPGSDGAIRTVFETFIDVGDTVIQTMPSFAMYPLYTQMYGGRTHALEYSGSAAGPVLGVDAICEAIGSVRPRLFCLPNPDSPTGTLLDLDELEKIIATAADVGSVALIDEAYYPFSEMSALQLIDRYTNLVVVQTFAKAWGIAGLRLGFAAAHPEMAKLLHKVRPMYEVNGFALAVMAGLIEHSDQVVGAAHRINDGKAYFINRMKAMGLRTLDCGGNFVHVDFGGRRDSVHAALKGKVLYKPSFGDACLEGYSRFTTAPKETMKRLVALIDGGLAEDKE
ncbi:MAG: histidinol-phosphate aminotransferase family protein [Rhodospirillales bacterium]|nr:histidinol-phosphate aminotransferase family protein [Rhodospirillales bacterium]